MLFLAYTKPKVPIIYISFLSVYGNGYNAGAGPSTVLIISYHLFIKRELRLVMSVLY